MSLEMAPKEKAADTCLCGNVQEGLELHRSTSWKQGHHSAEGWRITGKAPSKDGPGTVYESCHQLTCMHRNSSWDNASHTLCLLKGKDLGWGACICRQRCRDSSTYSLCNPGDMCLCWTLVYRNPRRS